MKPGGRPHPVAQWETVPFVDRLTEHAALVRLHAVLFLKEINAFFIGPKEDRDLEWRHVIGGWFIVGAPPAIGS